MKEHSPETKNLAFAVIHNKSQAHCDYCPAHCFSVEECVCVCVCIFTVSAVANPNAISDHHFQHVVVQEKASAHVFFIFSFLYFPFVFFIFFSFSMNNLSSLKTHFFPPLCIYLFVLVLRQTMFLLFKSNVLLKIYFIGQGTATMPNMKDPGCRLISFSPLPDGLTLCPFPATFFSPSLNHMPQFHFDAILGDLCHLIKYHSFRFVS